MAMIGYDVKEDMGCHHTGAEYVKGKVSPCHETTVAILDTADGKAMFCTEPGCGGELFEDQLVDEVDADEIVA
jgi:hypothetical protein